VRIRPQLIEAASVFAQAILVAAGLVTVGSFIASYLHPTTRLVADIYPMEFRMPVNGGDLGRAWTKLSPNQPMDPAIAHVFAVTDANGFARIDLRNEGSLPIDGIHIRAAGIGATYAKGTPNMGDTVVLPSDDKGITIEKLEQGSAITIYVWSGIILGSYSHWNGLDDQFQIIYSQGVAEKRFHIPAGTTAEFIDRHIVIFYTAFSVLFTLSVAGLAFRLFRGRQSGNVSALPGKVEIAFRKAAPYEETKVSHHHVLSTVRIGLTNPGGTPLSNCKVYIEAISPEPAILGGLPILLEGGGFTLRHDDPEKLIDIATHFDHVDKFRFNAPANGVFAETLNFIDDQPSRTILVKIEATGHQRSASFRLSTDDAKALHMEFLGYVN
jgi:hypothetical protein